MESHRHLAWPDASAEDLDSETDRLEGSLGVKVEIMNELKMH